MNIAGVTPQLFPCAGLVPGPPVGRCFNLVLEMIGTTVRGVLHGSPERRGNPGFDVPTQFDGGVAILNESFGRSARVIMCKTVLELCQHVLPLWQVTRFTGGMNGNCGDLTGSELTASGLARATDIATDGSTGSNSPQTTTVVKVFADAASQGVAKSFLINTRAQGIANNVRHPAATFRFITQLTRRHVSDYLEYPVDPALGAKCRAS